MQASDENMQASDENMQDRSGGLCYCLWWIVFMRVKWRMGRRRGIKLGNLNSC
jgi:hypothetical protein